MLSVPRELLLGRLGERVIAIPASNVERIMRMVALTPMADAPPGVAGLINLQGDVLPVVDPRPALGLPTPAVGLGQRLVLMTGATRFALWMDTVDQIVTLADGEVEAFAVEQAGSITPLVVRIGESIVSVLDPRVLDPGAVLDPISGHAG